MYIFNENDMDRVADKLSKKFDNFVLAKGFLMFMTESELLKREIPISGDSASGHLETDVHQETFRLFKNGLYDIKSMTVMALEELDSVGE